MFESEFQSEAIQQVRKKSVSSRLSRNKKKHKLFDSRLIDTCGQLLKSRVDKVTFPGGDSRKSCRLVLKNGRSVIATFRSVPARAKLECNVLRQIGSTVQGRVPRLIESDDGCLLIQEYLPGIRLSQALHDQQKSTIEPLLDDALRGLADIQQAGSRSGFDKVVGRIGNNGEWIEGLLDRPAVIGGFLKIKAPRPHLNQLFRLLKVTNPRFIKWDARPGNAMVSEKGRVAWFDWEHCGSRNRLDDVAWLLCDEFVPDLPELEASLIDRHISRFSDGFDIDQGREYLTAIGVFHSCVRLGLILSYKKDSSWWDYDTCLEGDKAGITMELAQRLCLRAGRWAKQSPLTIALSPWFFDIAEKMEEI